MFNWSKRAALYIHFPCFDGLISGVLTALFLRQRFGWNFTSIEPVNYDLRAEWISKRLPDRNAVVDFLYHPEAAFWADHHQTTFLDEASIASYQRRAHTWLFYDRERRSCASLLWDRVGRYFDGDSRLYEMVTWAEKIDSADYESVNEAVFGTHPSLVISTSLSVAADKKYCRFLVNRLSGSRLEDVGVLREVTKRYVQAQELLKKGIERVSRVIRLRDGIAVFDVEENGVRINRYVPYLFYGSAPYSIGIVRSSNMIKITAMRNPWQQFESPHLGRFMQKFGGGGHQRVGSVVLNKEDGDKASRILAELVLEMNASHHSEFFAKA